MEKFGLFNILQTPYSLPDAADLQSDLPFGEKLAAAFQNAESIASLLRGALNANETTQKTLAPSSASSADQPTNQSELAAVPIGEPELLQNGQFPSAQDAERVLSRKEHSGETYARFIQKQEALS